MRKSILSALLLALLGTPAAGAVDADGRNGFKGVTASINPERIHRSGNEVQFNIVFTNSKTKDERDVYLNFDDSPVIIDGEGNYPIAGVTDFGNVNFPAEETVAVNSWISGVPVNAEVITSIKLLGRAPRSSKATSSNYYGDFDYKFSNIPLPAFPESNRPGCVFQDTEFTLTVGRIDVSGKDLVIDFALTNNGRKDFSIEPGDWGRGVARTAEGDEFKVATKFPRTVPAGETCKGQMIINGGADETFATVRQGFFLSQDRNSWKPALILRNISKPQ